MKNTKTCPKCKGNNIVVIEGNGTLFGSRNGIMVGETVFSAVKVDRYLCGFCGFSEEWIRKEDIPRLMDSKHVRAYNV